MPALLSTRASSRSSSLLTSVVLKAREAESTSKSRGLSGWAIFIIILVVLIIAAIIAWLLYTRLRARRLGLPPPPLNPFAASRSGPSSNYPTPAPGGIKGWLDTQVRKFKNRRYATGAYEESSGAAGGYAGARGARGGHGPLDPDEAWDSSVGHEAYYEEQELGLHAPATNANTAYPGASGYGYAETPSPGERGRSRTRELDDRYKDETHGGLGTTHATNPFGDDNAASLRGVSPRPLETERAGDAYDAKGGQKTGSAESSPTERRSMFRENM
jgi:hypothetical protein